MSRNGRYLSSLSAGSGGTANSQILLLLAPTAVLDFSVGDGHPDEFSILRHEHLDGFPSTGPARFDGFTSTAESRDGFPSSADSKDHTNLNSTLDDKSTVFTPTFTHCRKLRTTPRVGFRSSNRAR